MYIYIYIHIYIYSASLQDLLFQNTMGVLCEPKLSPGGTLMSSPNLTRQPPTKRWQHLIHGLQWTWKRTWTTWVFLSAQQDLEIPKKYHE